MYKTVAADFDRIDFEFEKSSALRCYQIVLSTPEKPLIKKELMHSENFDIVLF